MDLEKISTTVDDNTDDSNTAGRKVFQLAVERLLFLQ